MRRATLIASGGLSLMPLFPTEWYGSFPSSSLRVQSPTGFQPFQDMVTSQVAAANRLIQRADAFCLIDPGCPFGQGNGSVVKVCTDFFPLVNFEVAP